MRLERMYYLTLIVLFALTACSSSEKEYEKARAENTIEAYEEYLTKYPDTPFKSEIEESICSLNFKKACSEDTIAAYENFLELYPEGQFVDRARLFIRKLSVGTIAGHIICDSSGEPLKDAQIILCSIPKEKMQNFFCTLKASPTVKSDKDGSFTLSNVPEGSYILLYGMQDELLVNPDEWDNVKLTQAEPCMKKMKNAVCPSSEAPESMFWQNGGTHLSDTIFGTRAPDDPEAFIIISKGGGVFQIHAYLGGVRSDRTGISLMIMEGKLAPVVVVQPGDTTDIEWKVIGR